MSDAASVLGLLADPARRKVLAAVDLGAASPADVAAATGLDTRTVATALHRLVAAGLVDDHGGRLAVRDDVFAAIARDAVAARPEPTMGDVDVPEGSEKVLRIFLRDGRLSQIPAVRSKRLVVLDFLASQFEPGRVYPERDVNLVLGRFHDDFAALRRHLVDEEFLERRDGFYWRAGGTFDV